ncbi:M17 family metallopeptidase [Homoserinibacter sp. GY 40078]|uniref:leucyl aminopeptidase family protein n=1 Tax=Homoserinibacter sp. GY 40078 TaxID=2603275 RepID=UPI0011C9AAB5|nr:leucyl aminopeptidase [Homoserinibacter sp. GY 40078]TXK18962.1 leucyl aminopeptidase [Homoserinibacter sp. GY 40078]
MVARSPGELLTPGFTAVPSVAWIDALEVSSSTPDDTEAIGITVASSGDVAEGLGFDRAALTRAGFGARPGQTLVIPTASGPALVAVGIGDPEALTPDALRDIAAAFARATASLRRVSLELTTSGPVDDAAAGQALAEGVVLARYRYRPLKTTTAEPPLDAVSITVEGADPAALAAGVARARATVHAASVARDLANTPPGHLTASDIGRVAVELGARFGFEVELFGREQLLELRCGGILGVNAGSEEEPVMVRLRHAGREGGRRLALVGKGLTYDSGGISLKPSDPMHLLMKMDMGGAGAILGAFTALDELGSASETTAWLMCTDNMPSGSAYKLGDVLTARDGTTVEVKNTDAEGRLAMMDALVLASEWEPDAIVDIATLTGASLMALGTRTAALFGNDDALLAAVESASATTGESAWRLPLERAYRSQLDSAVADISNLGGPYAGATTAALFLEHFVDGRPWAHLDIAGTMQSPVDDAWRSAGATGYGARLLAQLAVDFSS